MPSSEPGTVRVLLAERAVEQHWFEVGEAVAWALELEKVMVEVALYLYRPLNAR